MQLRFSRPSLAMHLALCGLAAGSLNAAVLLTTDFAGRTASGKTAGNITWTTGGLSAPGSLTAVDEAPTNASFAALFDSTDAQGYFAPDKNIDNEGPWSTTVAVSPTSPQVSLGSIGIAWRHFTNSGVFQGPDRGVQWTVTVSGSTSGLLPGGTAVASANAAQGLDTLTFGSPLALNDSETYDIRFFVETTGGQGNNTGFGALTFNGDIVPEPGPLVLLGFSALRLLVRRR